MEQRLIGASFGRLKIIELLEDRSKDKHRLVKCVCDCGNEAVKLLTRVKHGRVLSCGCAIKENKPGLTHGMKGTDTYASWSAAKNRCLCETARDYHRYGGKGITFHAHWAESFNIFLADMGERPAGTSLDRIDNTKGYEPGNCRWATRSEQQRNRPGRYEWYINGRVFNTAKEAADCFGVTDQTVCRWVLGAYDKRRNKRWEPKDECYRISRY